MIHGTSIFSMADLDDLSGYLFAKIKIKGIEYKCEIKQDNSVFDENDLTSDILRLDEYGEKIYDTVKNSRLYDFNHTKHSQW